MLREWNRRNPANNHRFLGFDWNWPRFKDDMRAGWDVYEPPVRAVIPDYLCVNSWGAYGGGGTASACLTGSVFDKDIDIVTSTGPVAGYGGGYGPSVGWDLPWELSSDIPDQPIGLSACGAGSYIVEVTACHDYLGGRTSVFVGAVAVGGYGSPSVVSKRWNFVSWD